MESFGEKREGEGEKAGRNGETENEEGACVHAHTMTSISLSILPEELDGERESS